MIGRHSTSARGAGAALLAGLLWSGSALAQTAPAEPAPDSTLEVIKVQGNVWMIGGAGGNIAVQAGDEGIVIVDTGANGVTDKVLAAIRSISTRPIRYVINTSMAPQHVGGNATIATLPGGSTGGATRGATPALIAQENVLNRMTTNASFPSAAWPTDGYFAPRRSFTYNNEAIDVIHMPKAYSDGDSAVYFRGSNVLVTGDLYTTVSLPMVNRALGGTYPGVIDALNAMLDITVPDDLAEGGTFIIPGHGRLSDEADLVEYRDMAWEIRDRVKKLAGEGKTLQQVKAARPAIGWEGRYGRPEWTVDMFIESVYPDFAPTAPAGPRTPARPRGESR